MSRIQSAKYGDEQRLYEREGNKKGVIKEWEDGFRTEGVKNAFEWWYFDAHLDDGSSLVIMFYSKTVFDAKGPLKPMATFELTTPDGKKIEESVMVPIEQFSSSKKTCDVKIGPCTFNGNLKEYTIHFEKDGIEADVKLIGKIPAWRQGNSYTYFGDDEKLYFSWLPSVPEGDVEASIKIGNKLKKYKGTGYHDHNWGNVNMAEIIHHWYWGRAKVGKYNFITANVISEKKYGYTPLSTFLLAENNKIIIGEDDMYKYMTFRTEDEYIDEYTNKTVANTVIFEYKKGSKHYRITYNRKQDISKYNMIDSLEGISKLMAKIISFSGSYLRFTGKVTIDKFKDGKIVESVTEPSAVWELMYFGKNIIPSDLK